MDTIFPVGLPWATAFYLLFYLMTLVVHVVFMNYVLAGTGYLAIAGIVLGPKLPRPQDGGGRYPVVETLVDWMPFMLSGAITAGVAPLLFVQVLYQEQFYTANLLLFHRWMSILPILLIGFYSLYLLKGEALRRRPAWVVAVMGAVPFLCMLFTGLSWTENHLLSLRGQDDWATFFENQRHIHWEPVLVPRLLLWGIGAVPTMATVLGWQLWYRQRKLDCRLESEPRHLSQLALIGFGLVAGDAIAVGVLADGVTRGALTSLAAAPYLGLASIGVVVQVIVWLQIRRHGRFTGKRLAVATCGLAATLVGMSICREVVRLMSLGPDTLADLYPLHARAQQVGGLAMFLVFFMLNASAVFYCLVLVKRAPKP